MAALNKFQDFAEQLLKGTHNFSAHTFKLALTNAAPLVTNTVLADITQIAATGGYVSGGYTLDSVAVTETGGVAKISIADEVITAAGGSVGPARYLVVYNDSATNKNLVGWYDYASSFTLLDTESFTTDIDGTNGFAQLT